MKRVVAWVVALLALWGIVKAADAWQNPWASVLSAPAVVNPVLQGLPSSPVGCGEKCRD